MTASLFYLDANAFIEMVERRTAASEKLMQLYQTKTRGHTVITTSELTLAEVLVTPLEQAAKYDIWHLAETYRRWISDKGSFQKVIPVDRGVLDHAAWIRARLPIQSGRKVSLPDAIHLATAIQTKCLVFVSADTRLNAAAREISRELEPVGPKKLKPLGKVLSFREDLSHFEAAVEELNQQ